MVGLLFQISSEKQKKESEMTPSLSENWMNLVAFRPGEIFKLEAAVTELNERSDL